MCTFLNTHSLCKTKFDFYLVEVGYIYLFTHSFVCNEYKNNLSVKYVNDIK
jgi:hypothetical protein